MVGIDFFSVFLEEFVGLVKEDEEVRKGYEVMIEVIVKDVFVLFFLVMFDLIYLSGCFLRILEFFRDVKEVFENVFEIYGFFVDVFKFESRVRVKEVVEGSLIIVNGIVGGKYWEFVEIFRLGESFGLIFDWVKLKEREKFRIFEKLIV